MPVAAPRVAVLVPISRLWAEVVEHDLAAERRAFAAEIATALGRAAEVVSASILSSREEGRDAGVAAMEAGAEVVLVVQTMGTQPAFTLAALDEVRGRPVVVWSAQSRETVDDAFDHASIVTEGGSVGTPMLTNVLVRRSLPFEVVEGPYRSEETLAAVADALAVGAAAARLRRARIGRVGEPIDGYDCVDADETLLEQDVVGEIVHIPPDEIRKRFLGVGDDALERLAQETVALFDVAADLTADELSRTLRLAAAVEDLCAAQALDAGVMNCHVPEIRFDPDVGATPCFGLGRATTSGVPWTCAGDVLTAIPMLALKLLGEGCVYHELEAHDRTTGEFVIANTGEHDLTLAAPGRPALVRNEWFARDAHCSACACYPLREGPAAIVGFTQIGRTHRFVAAAGEITGRSWPTVGTANGAFRFAAGADTWIRWCEAGVNHHSALTSAAALPRLDRLCRLLGIELVRI